MSNQLVFNDIQLPVIRKDNQIWITSTDLARALKYHSVKSVTNLYLINADEFTESMSEVIESMTPRNLKKSTRYFSLRGAHLVAMFARTQVAKDFRKWVLDVLDRESGVAEQVALPTVTPNRELLPKMVYHNRAPSKPYRAYVYDTALKREVSVGTFATVNEALDAQKAYFQQKPFTVAPIPKHGRWLVISNNHGIDVKNIDNYNCVNYVHFRKLQSDARTFANEMIKLLNQVQDMTTVSHEFLHRLKVLEGNENASRLNTPLTALIVK